MSNSTFRAKILSYVTSIWNTF